ncbi:phage integrase integrase [Alteracholeplasma palmae J233]|uniref:Phage integrase integrase n=1 Tax=Alteracholeplasma palmae (strain ATCC 49389 / J233) TaxID=1318466 RepID=U4KKV2_ALTPJ|nr:site-specific integrase [Alteracholeplasma palmae]CCV64332.1 phage integrase integrase [Alteracholeplasma palmae J233]
MTIEELITRYINETKNRKRSDTLINEPSAFRPILKCLKALNIEDANDLRYEDGERVIEWLKNNTRSKNTTINKRIGYIKTALRHSKLMSNTFLLVPKLPNDTEPFVPMQHEVLKAAIKLSEIEVNKNSWVYNAIFILLYDTGCRINELLNIQKHNVLIDVNTIVLETQTTKGRQQRYVYFTSVNVDLIKKLIRSTPGTYIFWNYIKNRKMSRDDFKNYTRKMKEKLNVDRFHAHQIRKKFATDMVVDGANLKTVQTILGHKDYKTTENYVKYDAIIARKEYEKIMNKKKSR